MAIIRITQYIGQSRKRAEIPVDIPDELKETAEGLEIGCEALPDMHVAIYAHRKEQSAEDELTEIANDGPGENSPNKALERLIRRFEKKPFKPFLEWGKIFLALAERPELGHSGPLIADLIFLCQGP